MKETYLLGLDEIKILANDFVNDYGSDFAKKISKKNILVLLKGDLASGKTTLVKTLVKALGSKEAVTSPTFCLQNIYGSKIFHYDMFSSKEEEFMRLGMLEEFDKDGIHFIEWANDELEKILKDYGFFYIKISIKKDEKENKNENENTQKRRYEISF